MMGLQEVAAQSYFGGPALVCGLAAMGLVVGVLTGLFGVGGAFLLTPLMNVLFGLPYGLCVGSSLSFTIGTGASGWSRHARGRNFEPLTMVLLALGAAGGVIVGAALNGCLQGAFGPRHVRRYTLTMHAMFVGLLLLTAYLVARPRGDRRGGRSLLQRLALPPRVHLRAAGLEGVSLPGLLLVGLLIGVANGLLGIGGGVLFMPLLVLAVGLSAHKAVGTSLGVVVFSSLAGTVQYGLKGDVSLWVVMPLLAGSTIGVQVGAWVCDRLHASRLRRYFAVVVLLTAAAIAADIVRKLAAP